MDAHNGGLKAFHGAVLFWKLDPDPHWSEKLDLDPLSGFRSFRCVKLSGGGSWTLTMEAWRLKIEPWRVCSPVVADSHLFDEKQDPDPH